VIGAICLLVLAGSTTIALTAKLIEATAHYLAPAPSVSRTDTLPQYTPDGVPVSLSIQNDGDLDDRLLGGWTPVAQCLGLRRTFLVEGRRETAPLPGGIVIPGEATVDLEPGKSHLALYGLRTDLIQGQTFSLTLQFEHAGDVTVIARVRRRVDAAGIEPLPEVSTGDLTIARASAPPAPGP
jgi:copper(I)-binding protein